jgi:predicted porin
MKRQYLAGVATAALTLAILSASGSANAQSVSDATVKALMNRIEQLEREVKELKQGQAQSSAEARTALKQANQAKTQATQAPVVKAGAEEIDKEGHRFLEHKKGTALTFYTPGGEITGYGNFDVSFDAASKNVKHLQLNGASPPVGNFGWMPDISTNLSYLGVRGFQRLGSVPFNFVYQLEAGIEISAAPGTRQSNSNLSNQVNGAVFSRNSFIGLASPDWGAIKIGKTDAPYKTSTAMFNPFNGMWGDYAVVMGNTGGDNRVEFGTRVSHAIWYESPTIGGLQLSALFAPGQNRSSTDDNVPSAEPDCAGGNDPTSGGLNPFACNDGSFGDLASASLTYKNGPLLITGAYEFHQKVNRQSDITGIFGLANPTLFQGPGVPTTFGSGGIGQALFNANVANEWAAKVGALYTFPTKTTVGGIFEWMRRDVPAFLQFQNERSRNGSWVFVSQQLTDADSVHFGWAHAFRANGDPGQHNSATLAGPTDPACTDQFGTPIGGCPSAFGPNQNQADMVTAAYKHLFSPNLTWYVNAAATFNGPSAHFDLGAGGRAVTTDCHDAFSTSGGAFSTPHCFTGTTLVGVSSGVKWTF